jgi:hypothetical protein
VQWLSLAHLALDEDRKRGRHAPFVERALLSDLPATNRAVQTSLLRKINFSLCKSFLREGWLLPGNYRAKPQKVM